MVVANPTPAKPIVPVLDAEVAFLVGHYFGHVISASFSLDNSIAESQAGSLKNSKVLQFSRRFFKWMPMIDSFGSWQSELAEQWVARSQRSVCQSAPVSRGCEFIKLISSELQFNEIDKDFKADALEGN